MSQDKELYPLPFLTRDMLRFEFGTKFTLNVSYRAATTTNFTITGATREGPFKFTIKPTQDTATHKIKFNIPDMPIWISVIDQLGTINRGMLYVNVALEINNDKMHVLCAGYIYSTQAISWPITNIETPEIVKGEIEDTVGANPAAGAEIDMAVPLGESWRIISCTFTLVTDATVANRRVHLVFSINGLTSVECISSIDQTANQTKNYTCIPTGAGATLSDDNDIIIPIPPNLILPQDDRIWTETTNLQAGDNFGIPTVIYERYMVLGTPV